MCSNVRMLVTMLVNVGKPCQHRDVGDNVGENVGMFKNMLCKMPTWWTLRFWNYFAFELFKSYELGKYIAKRLFPSLIIISKQKQWLLQKMKFSQKRYASTFVCTKGYKGSNIVFNVWMEMVKFSLLWKNVALFFFSFFLKSKAIQSTLRRYKRR